MREAIAAGVPVIPIPGANAAHQRADCLRAADRRVSVPRISAGEGRRAAHAAGRAGRARRAKQPRTLIFYEAPHRILDTLADLEAAWGAELRVVVARELTKIHEEFLRGTVAEVRRELAGARTHSRRNHAAGGSACGGHRRGGLRRRLAETVTAGVERMQAESGVDEKEALKRLARELGQSKSELYRELQRERARRR